MGEAVYHLKARFPSAQHLKKNFPEIKRFWREGIRAGDFWQDNRGGPRRQFWRLFSEKFPLVSEYLQSIPSHDRDLCADFRITGISNKDPVVSTGPMSLFGQDHNNALSGTLDFGCPEDLGNLRCEGACLLFHAEVWHFARWEYLTEFLENKWGATNAMYCSNEYNNEDEIEAMMEVS